MWPILFFLLKILLALLLQTLAHFWWPSLIFAQTPSLIINEVHPAPSSGNDWVEIKNLSNETIVLTGWSLEDSSGALSTSPSMGTQSLVPQNYLVIEVSNRLNNTGDTITLKNAEGQTADQFVYTSTTTDISWSRIPDGSGNWAMSTPSKGTANPTASLPTPSPSPSPSSSASPSPTPTPTPTAFPTSLQLSEIMACPETGEKEWIELYNPDNVEYQLSNWKLKDSASNARSISGTVAAQTFTIFELSTSMFNNDGDSLSLENPSGAQLFSIQFSKCSKNHSFVYYDGAWQETTQVTKGSANTYLSPDAAEEAESSTPVSTENADASTASPPSSASNPTQNAPANNPQPISQLTSPFALSQFFAFRTEDANTTESATVAASRSSRLITPPNPLQNSILQPLLKLSPTTTLTIFCLGLFLFLGGVFEFYRWYTEQHAEKDDGFS